VLDFYPDERNQIGGIVCIDCHYDIARLLPRRLLHAEKPCKNYEFGSCNQGAACFFSHDETVQDVLKRLGGVLCPFGTKSACPSIICPYLHREE